MIDVIVHCYICSLLIIHLAQEIHLGWAVAGSDLVSVSDTINWLLHQARQVTIHWPALHTSYKTKHRVNSNNVMIEGY